ncbi:MAG: hypothetical protein ACKOUM_06620, partial [Sphingopyxis sp.]
AAHHGLPLNSMVPAGALLPIAPPGSAVAATIGHQHIIRAGALPFCADDNLASAILGTQPAPVAMDAHGVDAAIITICDAPAAEMLTGPWAPQRHDAAGPFPWRVLKLLFAALIMASLLIGVARCTRTHAAADALEADMARTLATALPNSPAPADAINALDGAMARVGGGPQRSAPLVAGLIASMEPFPNVAVETMAWRGDGVLTVSLGAPRTEDINMVLIALQDAGYLITAQSRAGTDGRSLCDLTIRAAP